MTDFNLQKIKGKAQREWDLEAFKRSTFVEAGVYPVSQGEIERGPVLLYLGRRADRVVVYVESDPIFYGILETDGLRIYRFQAETLDFNPTTGILRAQPKVDWGSFWFFGVMSTFIGAGLGFLVLLVGALLLYLAGKLSLVTIKIARK